MVGIIAIVDLLRQDRQEIKDVVGMTRILVLKYLDMLLVMKKYQKLISVKPGMGRTASSTTDRRTGSSR